MAYSVEAFICGECHQLYRSERDAVYCERGHESDLTALRDFVPHTSGYIEVANHYIEKEGWGDPLDFFDRYPFLSEAVLYPILGKDDARTVLALLDSAIRKEQEAMQS
jgi:hypothetical protein